MDLKVCEEALALAILNKQHAEWESSVKQQCLMDALREIPKDQAEIVWNKFNELMRKARGNENTKTS